MQDNFEFPNLVEDFIGYISSRDKTNTSEKVLVHGSKNVYKKVSGTVASRPGLLRRGSADSTPTGITSNVDWYNSLGRTLPIRVVDVSGAGGDAKIQVESDIVTAGTPVWYDLLTSLSLTRVIFDTWWDNTEKKDRLLFVLGNSNMYHWSGGMAILASGNNRTISTVGNNAAMTAYVPTVSGANLQAVTNGLVGVSEQGAISLLGQPSNGDSITLTINGTAVLIHFVSVIGAVAGNVLIGAATSNTLANLLGLLQNPSSTTATQVALSSGNQTLVAYMTYASGSGLIKTGTTSWAQSGFASNTAGEKKVKINGTEYTYTGGENSTVLTGVTADPSGEAANSIAIQSVIVESNVPAGSFTNDFIKTINNRVHVGSYTSRLVYISANDNFKNYVVPVPRTPGTPELLTLDNPTKGITVRGGNAWISAGLSDWYEISYTQITFGAGLAEQTAVDKKPIAYLCAALGHEFIDTVGDNIIFLSQDQQVRTIGIFKDNFEDQYPSMSREVQDEFTLEDFDGGALRTIGDFIYITCPNTGRDWMHETQEVIDPSGAVVAERCWHPPQVRNISRFSVIDGVLFGHSNANPQIYQVWDTGQWHDDSPSGEPLSYDCVMIMSYRNYGRRQGMLSFDKVYYEGYIATGVSLYGNIYFDYQGASGLQNVTISAPNSEANFFSSNGAGISLGDSPLGSNPLGDGLITDMDDQDLLAKYRAICNITAINCFEFQLEVYSVDLDCRWEMLCLGANVVKSTQQAGFIRK